MGVVLHDPIAKFRRTLGDRYIQIYFLMSRYLDKPNTTLRRPSRGWSRRRESLLKYTFTIFDGESDRKLGLVKKIIPDDDEFYFKMAVAMNLMSFRSIKNKISNVGFSTHVSHLKIGVYSMGANCLIYPITVGSYSNVKIN